MGLERAHTQLLGQGEGLAVGGFGQLNLRRIALRVDDAEQPQGPRLLASPLQLAASARVRSASWLASSLRPARR